MLRELKLNDFVETVASSSPAPGGGSCSSLAGAIGSSLAAMVCQLTFGKKGYEESDKIKRNHFQSSFQLLEQASQELMTLIDKDTEAFNQIMAAFKLPKDSDSDKTARSEAIQTATWNAIATPKRMAELCLKSLESLEIIAELGNKNAVSDLGVSVLMLQAGLKGANMNVLINLSSVKDQQRADETLSTILSYEKTADEIATALLSKINKELRG